MFLVDLRPKKITGKTAEAVLGKANITVNKNAIPNDPEKPFVTSGIRLGTAAITTRGFKENDTRELAHLIADALENAENEQMIAEIGNKVKNICNRLPVYSK